MRSAPLPHCLIASLLVLTVACQRTPAAKRYPLHGQVLAVDAAKRELTVKHDDIPNLMPAMTMAYPVASAQLIAGRAPGEMINAVLEVTDSAAVIVEIHHEGTAPLPANANQVGILSGVLGPGDAVPDTAFIDQTNKRRSLNEWKGAPAVLTFTYTRCPLPNFCPLMDQNFATLQRRLVDDTILRGHVKLITISFDPERDTPEVLAAHASKLKADPAIWTFLTGDAPTVERFAGKFGVSVLRDNSDPSQITHNLRTALIGPDMHVVKVYTGNEWTPGEVLADLRSIVNAK